MARRRYEQEEIVNLHTVCIRAEPQCKSYENYCIGVSHDRGIGGCRVL